VVRAAGDGRARGPHQAPHGPTGTPPGRGAATATPPTVRAVRRGRQQRCPTGVGAWHAHRRSHLVIRLNNGPRATAGTRSTWFASFTAWFAEAGGLRRRWLRWRRGLRRCLEARRDLRAGGRAEAGAVYSTNLIVSRDVRFPCFFYSFFYAFLLF
jgi:hypothetical protein